MKNKLFKFLFGFLIGGILISNFPFLTFASNDDVIIGYEMDADRNISNIYNSSTLGYNLTSTSAYIPNDSDYNTSDLREIIGPDNRVVVSGDDMTSYPYRMVCRIVVQFDENPGVGYLGTGFLVGPSTILTSCHVVFSENYGFFDSISFGFGAYKDEITNLMVYPYGQTSSWNHVSVGRYNDTKNENDDWAIIDLNVNIGSTLGYFGVTSTLYNNESVKTFGYSGDLNGNLAYSYGVTSSVSTYKFSHTCDTLGGASGGPVCKYGVVAAGIHHGGSSSMNSACKISDYIVGWINDRLDN